MEASKQGRHFVLVHGACHGAWCWFKLQTLLEEAGQRVTSIDLAAAGINPKGLDELRSFVDYSQPLLDLLKSTPEGEKVVLVGHSQGGMNMSFAMEQYPQKIYAAIFVSALLPDTVHNPCYPLDQFMERYGTPDYVMDTKFEQFGRPEDHLLSQLFGPEFISVKVYPQSPPEDATLAKLLARPCCLFMEYLQNSIPFSKEKFGSVKRAYVVLKGDITIPQDFQRWMIQNNGGVAMVKEIEGSDHMAMISKPHELCQCLLEIANSIFKK